MSLDREAAGRIADAHLRHWREGTTYGELVQRDLHRSVVDSEVTENGVTYRVSATVWREQGDPAMVMTVKVKRAGGGLFSRSVLRQGRMHPDGTYVDGL
jgi:hypothetical protein